MLLQLVQHGGAGFSDAGLDAGAAGHDAPAALLDECRLLPRADFFELDDIRRGIGTALQLLDADWCYGGDDGLAGPVCRRGARRVAEHPAAEAEAFTPHPPGARAS